MSNVIVFPSPKHSEPASEAEFQAARDQLVALLANLDALNSELSLLVLEGNKQAPPAIPHKPAPLPGGVSRGNSSAGAG